MPEKTSKQGRKYEIDGRKVVWHPEDDDGVTGNLPEVRLPLRIKMGLVLDMATEELDNAAMAQMIERLTPGQMDIIREMGVECGDDALFNIYGIAHFKAQRNQLNQFVALHHAA